MKIGILTFHSQINYGGVLQAYALQTVLGREGFDATVVDYWCSPNNTYLYGAYLDPSVPLWKRAAYLAYHTARYGFAVGELVRRLRTIRFLKTRMRLSKEVYRTPGDLARLSGFDCVISGSDQVWSYRVPGRPNPFLLGALPESVRRVAYAPSLGFKTLPPERTQEYGEALKRFTALSVREQDACDLVEAWCGRRPEWVLDPTLLMDERDWFKVAPRKAARRAPVFCYWLGDVTLAWPLLRRLAKETGQPCRLYVDGYLNVGGRSFLRRALFRLRVALSRSVRLCRSAGPAEFLSDLAGSAAVVSDSFHAMMFAFAFRKPLRIFVESAPGREQMSSRFFSFASRYGCEPAVSAKVAGPVALYAPDYRAVFARIEDDRRRSLAFLASAVGGGAP